MTFRRTILAFCFTTGFSGAALGQGVAASALPATSEPGSELTISLITFGSGELIFERFGHNALRFQDATTGEDVAYHWGLFSFSEPGFLTRFLTGETNYWMGAVDARALIESETSRGRHATVQRLNLTPLQAFRLRDFVRWNEREENKFYRYDYYVDNCSTRLRDALDAALGGVLKRAKDTVMTTHTYRSESVRLTDEPARGGINVALGKPADAPLSEWQSYFIPMRLRDGLRTVTVTDASGQSIPLVAQEEVPALAPGRLARTEPASAPRLAWGYLAVGALVATLVVALGAIVSSRPGRAAPLALAVFGSIWSLVCGLMGVILVLAWTATKHQFWAWNDNVLLLNPISIALAVLVPFALLGRTKERAARLVSLVVVALGAIALLRAAIPGGQENLAVVAMVLPVHLAIAWVLGRPWARSPHPRLN